MNKAIIEDLSPIMRPDIIALLGPVYDKMTLSNKKLAQLIFAANKNEELDLEPKRTLPYGNNDASLMIVDTFCYPQDIKNFTSFSSAPGMVVVGMLKSLGVTPEEVYLTNVYKDLSYIHLKNSEELYTQTYHEIVDHLFKEIAIVRPKIILILGEVASNCFKEYTEMSNKEQHVPINMLRSLEGHLKLGDYEATVLYSLSPGDLLYRHMNMEQRNQSKLLLWEDTKKAVMMSK